MLAELADLIGVSTFDLFPIIAIVLLGISCGMVGSLVVANRMAFFSDAMAHTAFAGVGLAVLGIVLVTAVRSTHQADEYRPVITAIMVAIGCLVGLGIGYVRERTGLTNDTVIGVFFALAVGVGSMLLPEVRRIVNMNTEELLFGSVAVAGERQIYTLAFLAVVTAVVVVWRYNALVFVSFNPSLARSRGVNVRAANYLLIILLVLVVNLSIEAIGVLLINAMLVVPAAAAANFGRNLREVFRYSVLGAVGCGLLGWQLHNWIRIPLGAGRQPLEFGPGGTIVVTCVGLFFLSMLYARVRGRSAGADRAG